MALFAAATTGQPLGAQTVEQASVLLLQHEEVRKELGMTAGQRSAVDSAYKKHAASAQALFKQKPKTDAERKALQQKLLRSQTDFSNRCLEILNAAQRSRLRQLGLQFFGPFTMLSAEISKELGLSEPQKKKIRAAQDTLNKQAAQLQSKRLAELRAVPQPKDPNDAKAVAAYQKKLQQIAQSHQAADARAMDAAKKQAEASLMAALTAAQRTKWAGMIGKKFTIRGKPASSA